MEEAKQLHRSLLKFTRGESTSASEAVEVLRALERTTITYAILKETKLGHTVGKLRKHEDDKLGALARSLVKSWKSLAGVSPRAPESSSSSNGNAERKTSGASSSEGSRTSTPKSTTTSSSQPVKSTSSSSSSNGAKPAAAKAAGAPRRALVIPDGLDKMRATVRTKLKEVLEVSEGGEPADIATSIEMSMARMFNMGFPGENKKDYTAKFRQLSFNLKKNAPLREDLLQEMVSAEQLIHMSADELATEEKRNEIAKLRDDAFQKARLDWADANEDKINKQCGIENAKGLFTCGRCKSTKTSNTQKQTRSADEPMTVFVQCHNCGNRWKC